MYVKDHEKLTGMLWCPKCNAYCVKINDKNCNAASNIKNHIDNCDGTFKAMIDLQKIQKPYIPFVTKQPALMGSLALGVVDVNGNNIDGTCLRHEPVRGYMCYDFKQKRM